MKLTEYLPIGQLLQIVIIAVIILILILFLKSKLSTKGGKGKGSDNDINQFKGVYMKLNVLTNHELKYFYAISSASNQLGLFVFPKVRLADIIKPKDNCKDWMALFNRVNRKHVDFLICKSDLSTLCVLEIDDYSHDLEKGKKRDEFVDYILADVGIPTIRKRSVTTIELQNDLKKLINK